MRTKSESRRQAIVSAAAGAFQRSGFENTSMEDIAAAVPCSKGTLYGYFESKEALFYEAIVEATDVHFREPFVLLHDTTSPAREVLLRFGERFIAQVCSPGVHTLRRLVMTASAGGATELAARCYEAGAGWGLKECAAYLEMAQARGELRVPSPSVAGLQLRALLEAEWLDSLLYGERVKATKQRVRGSAQRAIDAFFKIYGPDAATT